MNKINENDEGLFAQSLGKIIRELRKEKGLSQLELGDLLFTGQDTVSLWELGKRVPDVRAIVAMAKLFDVTTDYLLGLENC